MSPKLTKMKIIDEKSLQKYMNVYQEEEAKSAAVAQQKISTIPFTPIPYKSGYFTFCYIRSTFLNFFDAFHYVMIFFIFFVLI